MNRRIAVSLMILTAIALACEPAGRTEKELDMDRPPLESVIRDHGDRLLAIEGVAGVYESRNHAKEPVLKIMVVELTPELRSQLPKTIEGYPVLIVETGEIAPR